ncbi:uncharacterized protein VDAG_06716 [Verticillium dahliae VdLs.17]|uniref:Uncharacterized protein n=2 Tax=Verticillium dahliae TaxID=27337 RepID=G2X984_VERDV|nr:uncharacterized protein VDAG_06716 [Verticillium dahliae VdLs.17]EGY15552.1 hypothetical protein VDAG_06716 [Verticillium dahliae VdLs.17]KAF3342622.1 LSM domain-containing protein 1-B [Verticillium dahliae VDG2]PNH35782.1 hypothetical protein BJF96_g963 [Verticillium dahliae]PNH54214.1 hypothetical protein VD0003_g3288 [Verticillium dahliae]
MALTPDPRGDALAGLMPPTSPHAHQDPAASLRCCCGHDDCAYLKHSCHVLDTVEQDVHTAAKLGQALLARHEAYMADAERDRLELTARIEQLETDKRELQADNARTVEENRALLDQLETLNNSVNSSDTRIQSLEATLLSSQQAVRRLEGAAVRAAELERHVALLEREQMQLQNTLISTESESRSALNRWKKAERGITELQEQLERMEKETKDERERHVEAMGRVERQREMEKELNTAAGRLKGAAAAKSLDKGKHGSSVVSHFVRDLLQDNANLQLGMAELRELLTNSNDEIQALRDQLMFHQPVDEGEKEGERSTASTLRAEMDPSQMEEPGATTRLSQELHIHHHYHVASKGDNKKPKKRRAGLTPGIFTPPSGASTPVTPFRNHPWRLSSPVPPTTSTHGHRDSTSSLAAPPSHRWSMFSEQQSDFAASSVPSSPQSTSHRFSMFDKFPDSDLPASPTTSVDPMSPTMRATHLKRPSEVSTRSISMPAKLMIAPPAPTLEVTQHHLGPEPIREEVHEDDTEIEEVPEIVTTEEEYSFSTDEEQPQRRLHRVISHESIMSLAGGLDIHTLKVRPSQLTLRPLGGAEAVFTGVTASSTISRVTTKRSTAVLRDSLAGLPSQRVVSTPTRSLSPASTLNEGQRNTAKPGRWTSWRPWGSSGGGGVATSSSSNSTPNDPESSPTPALTPTPTNKKADKERDLHRASGINQPGAIPGFQEYLASIRTRGTPSKVMPDVVDVEALRQILEEE